MIFRLDNLFAGIWPFLKRREKWASITVVIPRRIAPHRVRPGWSPSPESVVVFDWNQWSPCAGTGGRLRLESAVAFSRNTHAHLIALPANPFPTDEQITVSIGKTPYARFDGNDYSVPHTQVRRVLNLSASLTRVRLLDGATVIAEHPRSYGKGEQIEDPDHLAALVAAKRAARHHRGQDRLAQAAPASQILLQQAAARGTPLPRATRHLVELLDAYGAAELEQAIAEALANQVPHPNAVRQVLERRREQRDRPPPLPLTLADNDKARQVIVRPASLADYDQLDPDPEPTDDPNPCDD